MTYFSVFCETKLKIQSRKQDLNAIQILDAVTGNKFAVIWHWRTDKIKGPSSRKRLKNTCGRVQEG